MANWFIVHPVISGIVTTLLMWIDWLLTVAQEQERSTHYSAHYESYPVNTIEGNVAVREGVSGQKILYSRHIIAALIIGAGIGYLITWFHDPWNILFLGYVWGLFLLVITQHLSNLLGYKAGQKGITGKIRMHQRTGYLTQSGRYFSLSVLLLVLSILSGSLFLYGVTIGGFTSALRQLLWMRKVPEIKPDEVS